MVLLCATVQLCWLLWETLENCKQIKQQMRDLPGLSSSDSESESGSVSVVSGAKVTILSLLTLGEVTAVRLTKYLYIPRAT